MAGVEFEEGQVPKAYTSEVQNGSTLTRFMIRNGIVRTEQQATYVLLGCIAVVAIIAIFIFTNRPKGTQPLTPQQIEKVKADQAKLLNQR